MLPRIWRAEPVPKGLRLFEAARKTCAESISSVIIHHIHVPEPLLRQSREGSLQIRRPAFRSPPAPTCRSGRDWLRARQISTGRLNTIASGRRVSSRRQRQQALRRAFAATLVASITVSLPRRRRLAVISRSSWNASAEALWSAFVVGNHGSQGVRGNNLGARKMFSRECRFAASCRADQEHQSAFGDGQEHVCSIVVRREPILEDSLVRRRSADAVLHALLCRPADPQLAGAVHQGRSASQRHAGRPAARILVRAVLRGDGPAAGTRWRIRPIAAISSPICIAFWSVFTAGCALARSYTTLFLARMGVGIGEAGLNPAVLLDPGGSFSQGTAGRRAERVLYRQHAGVEPGAHRRGNRRAGGDAPARNHGADFGNHGLLASDVS